MLDVLVPLLMLWDMSFDLLVERCSSMLVPRGIVLITLQDILFLIQSPPLFMNIILTDSMEKIKENVFGTASDLDFYIIKDIL